MSAATPPSAPEPLRDVVESGGDQGPACGAEVTPPTAAGSGAATPAGFNTAASLEAPAPKPRAAGADQPPRKGPLSFLSGALTSALLGWLCLGLSQKVLAYYALHPPHYTAQIAQSIATALKTLIVGMCFLATFSFAFIGLGLFLTFLRSLMPGYGEQRES